MSRKHHRLNGLAIIWILAFSASVFYFLLPDMLPIANSSPAGVSKPINFYFHNDTSNPWIGSGYARTTATLNTTQKWRETPQGYINSSGTLPLDFYVAPDLAADVFLNGTMWLHPWMAGWTPTGATPKGTFKVDIYEVTYLGGQVLVGSTGASGSMNLAYGSTPAHSRDVNSVAGNTPLKLTFSSHTFKKGSSILLHIEVVPGGGTVMSFYYDNNISPSYVTFYSENYVDIPQVWTANATGYPTIVFVAIETTNLVQINANITDPFGGYDFNASQVGTKHARVSVTVVNPAGVNVVDNERMTLMQGGLSSFSNILQYNWTFSLAVPGRHNITVTATDNTGNTAVGTAFFIIGQTYRLQAQAVDSKARPLINAYIAAYAAGYAALSDHTNSSGWIDRQIVSGVYNFTVTWQGTVVNSTLNLVVNANTTLVFTCRVFDLTFRFIDDVDTPLPEAQVFIEWPNGTANILPLYTTIGGLVNLTQAPAGNYTINVFWKSVNVQTATVTVISDGPYTIRTKVYQLTAEVSGNNGAPVRGAYVVVSTQAGVVYDFKMTNASGMAVFKLPVGVYRIDAYYSTTYWLSSIATNASESPVSVTSSGLVAVTFTDFPPSITSTIGFWLLVIPIIVVVALVAYIIYTRRRVPRPLHTTKSTQTKRVKTLPNSAKTT